MIISKPIKFYRALYKKKLVCKFLILNTKKMIKKQLQSDMVNKNIVKITITGIPGCSNNKAHVKCLPIIKIFIKIIILKFLLTHIV